MKKILGFATLSLALIFASCQEDEKQKAVLELVSAETVSVSATGGEQTIQVNSNSALTAKSSASWVTVAVKDNNTVTATVAAYDGADTRSATVTISNESELTPLNVRINQAAVQFDFNPNDYEFEAEGGSYSFPYTAETTLTAVADEDGEDWLTVDVKASEVVLTAAANEAISPRESVVAWTIGSAKGEFMVSQKAAGIVFSGDFKNIEAPLVGSETVYEYTTNSELLVNSDEEWIETWAEDGEFHIVVASNTGSAREGYITWSVKNSDQKGEIKVSQKGTFINVSLKPTVYSQRPTSSLCNTLALTLVALNGDVTAIKYAAFYEGGALAGATTEQLKAEIDAKGESLSNDLIENVNGGGLNYILSITLDAGTAYDAIVWASNGTDEAYFALSASTLTEIINDEFDMSSEFYLVPDKSVLYGEYYFLAKETESLAQPIDWGSRNFQGMVTFSDGDMSEDEYGTYDWINVEGMWGCQFNSNYRLTNDIHQLDLYDGFLYSQDPASVGDLVQVSTGSVAYSNIGVYTSFSNSGYIFGGLYGALVGGVVDEDGTIAFISSEIYADQNDSEGDVLGEYVATLLYIRGLGWVAGLKDFMFVPSGSYSPAKVAAASKKVEAIKKEARSMRRNYVELRDTRIEKAFKKVLSESKMHEASAI